MVDEDKAFSEPEAMVNAAYAMLGDCWYTYPFNLFPYGDITSDDCLKGGSGPNDTGYHAFDIWTTLTPTRALVALEQNGVSVLGEETTRQRVAEVRFLRGHFYYKLLTVFRQVPWIDEEVYKNNTYEETRNDALTYERIRCVASEKAG